MSYDISLEIDTGGEHPLEVEWWNYTWNCGPMFGLAMPEGGIHELRGKTAPEALAILERGLAYWDAHLDEMRALDPPNGWGDSVSARDLLAKIAAACREHPKTTVSVS